MPPKCFESEVESFLEGSHGDRTHIKRADHPRLHHYAGHYSRFPLVTEIVRTGNHTPTTPTDATRSLRDFLPLVQRDGHTPLPVSPVCSACGGRTGDTRS